MYDESLFLMRGIIVGRHSKMIETLKTDLKNLSSDNFLNKYLFDRIPHIFQSDRNAFVHWKAKLGQMLEIDPAAILFVGTACIGYSLNPQKNLRQFGAESDVDIAIVSNYHFLIAWRYLRANYRTNSTLPEFQKIAWREHQTNYIYWGTIATDKLLGIFPFGPLWRKAISEMQKEATTVGRTINLRIYNDFDSLRSYQRLGVETIKNELLERG